MNSLVLFGAVAAKRALRVAGFAIMGSLLAESSMANDLVWSGRYRVEGVRINNSELDGKKTDKAYMLHSFSLFPKFSVGDGVTIFGRFDVLQNSAFGQRTVGDFIGRGVGSGTGTTTGSEDSNVASRTQSPSAIVTRHLYVSWAHEYGQFIAGRAPTEFGLGIWRSAGLGVFDHDASILDMVAYKAVLGSVYIMPMLGKVSEGQTGQEDDVNDYILHVQYDNPETQTSAGFIWETRIGSGNDIPYGFSTSRPYGSDLGGVGATRTGDYKHTYFGFTTLQRFDDFRVGAEAGIINGETGVKTATGSNVKVDAIGIALELAHEPKEGSWWTQLKLGFASGDDPGTDDNFEGYHFHRNYKLGFLLFNHPLGQRDFLRTGHLRGSSSVASQQIDSEAISNVIYYAPSITHRSGEKYEYTAQLIGARLNKGRVRQPDGSVVDASLDVGWEVDFGFTYKPFNRVRWTTDVGFLFPGTAWRAGTSELPNQFAYGAQTRVAFSF